MKKIILIPPCYTYGDCLSVIGLLYYLTNYYDIVYFDLKNEYGDVVAYYNNFFKNEPLFKEGRIILSPDSGSLIENGSYNEYHVCNTRTHCWSKSNELYYDLGKIDKSNYFNTENPISNYIKDNNNTLDYNRVLPNENVCVNHIFYYEMVGISNNVRMNYFNYVRDLQYEKLVKSHILKKYDIKEDEKYNIINDPIGVGNKQTLNIDNDYKIINLNFLWENIGELLTLIEDAETINLIEGSNVNFLYHCDYKGIFKYSGNINFHIHLRNRNWERYNLDYAWKMMANPKLENWNFIYENNIA